MGHQNAKAEKRACDKSQRGSGAGMRLSGRFTVLVSVLVAVAVAFYLAWTFQVQHEAAERKALGEARVLDSEMAAIWDYVNDNQDRINYNSDGTYDFKGVYCTIAGKDIAKRFMLSAEYGIRFVRENPRSAPDEPDAFERLALEAFAAGQTEFYGVDSHAESGRTFRYVSALEVDRNCLSCHGGPAGELDETGFIKEGMDVGDLAGAVSITIPLDVYEEEIVQGLVRDVVFFAALLVIVLLVVRFAMRRWVTVPLETMEHAVSSLEAGTLSIDTHAIGGRGEIAHLAAAFANMAAQLQDAYSDLEGKVEDRTVELARANETLQRQQEQLARVNEALVQANAQLREESDFKSDFLAVMSHELRAPLTAILAELDLWERESAGLQPEDVAMMRDVKGNCTALLAMVENTVDTAKLEAGKMQLCIDEVDVVDVLNEVDAVMRPLAAKKHIDMDVRVAADAPIIKGDWEALRKVFTNLVSNALKFTPDGGAVSVHASACLEGRAVLVEVKDSGCGIASGDQERVFDRFVQADSSMSREHGGSGLGLSLVKSLVSMMDGTVTLRSAQGEGSVFSVVLPAFPFDGDDSDERMAGTDDAGRE